MLAFERMLSRRLADVSRASTNRFTSKSGNTQRVSHISTSSTRFPLPFTSAQRVLATSAEKNAVGIPPALNQRVPILVTFGARTASTDSSRKRSQTTKPKSKRKTKAKKAKKPKKPQKPKRTVLTAEQKEKAAEKERKQKIRDLKKEAFLGSKDGPPNPRPASVWNVLIAEVTKGIGGLNANVDAAKSKYQSLSPAQREHYNQVAKQTTAERQIRYRQWVESYPVARIAAANRARRSLKRLLQNGGARIRPKNLKPIQDDRQPTRPLSSYLRYAQERFASGDMQHIKVSEAAKLIGSEWKALEPEQKKTYIEDAAADRSRYAMESKTVQG